MLAAGVVVGVALAGVWQFPTDGSATAGGSETDCVAVAEQLTIAADGAVVSIVRDLADQFTVDLRDLGRPCVQIDVRAVSSSAVVGRLGNGWRTDTHGPRPDVWIPKSTLWVSLLRDQLDDPSMVVEDPTVLARSPTVMALPRPMAERLGWPDKRLPWSRFLALADSDGGWAGEERPQWGPFRLDITDPRYTTTGLQALLALDAAQSHDDNVKTGSTLSLFRVQRALAAIDASTTETLRRYRTARQPLHALSALPIEERELWRYNQMTSSPSEAGTPSPSDAPTPSGTSSPSGAPSASGGAATAAGAAAQADRGRSNRASPPELVAMYPADSDGIAMESDYPYVQLDTTWISDDAFQLADEFGDYLLSAEGVRRFTQAGFRTRDNEAGEVLRRDECLVALDDVAAQPPSELPAVSQFRRVRSSWVAVPRVSRTLFLLDVSGSMVTYVPGTGRTRLQATVDAAKRTIDIMPIGSDVGLWEFSTDLGGGSKTGDYRELEPIARLDAVEDGRSHRDRLLAALDDIDPERDTALYDSLLAAYTHLRDTYVPGRRHLIVLLTDGRNDDARSITEDELLRRLAMEHVPQEPIQVVSIAYGDQADVDVLAAISEVVGGRVIRSPERGSLDRKFIEALAR